MASQLTVNLLPVEWELRVFSPENNIGKPWEWACHVKADPLGNKWLTLANGWPSPDQVRAVSVELSRIGWREVFAVRYEHGVRHVYAIGQDGRSMEVEFSINEVTRRRECPSADQVSNHEGVLAMQNPASKQSHVTTVGFNGVNHEISHAGGVDSMIRVTQLVSQHVGAAHRRITPGQPIVTDAKAIKLPVTWHTVTDGVTHDQGQHMMTFATQADVTAFSNELATVHSGVVFDHGKVGPTAVTK